MKGNKSESAGFDPSDNRHWAQQSTQVPRRIASEFKQAGRAEGPGGVKMVGTAAMGLLLGAPEHVRAAVMEFVNIVGRRRPDRLDPKDIWAVAEAAMRSGEGGIGDREHVASWYIDRILTPGISPGTEQSRDEDEDEERGRKVS